MCSSRSGTARAVTAANRSASENVSNNAVAVKSNSDLQQQSVPICKLFTVSPVLHLKPKMIECQFFHCSSLGLDQNTVRMTRRMAQKVQTEQVKQFQQPQHLHQTQQIHPPNGITKVQQPKVSLFHSIYFIFITSLRKLYSVGTDRIGSSIFCSSSRVKSDRMKNTTKPLPAFSLMILCLPKCAHIVHGQPESLQ